jgi:hypothetical protein
MDYPLPLPTIDFVRDENTKQFDADPATSLTEISPKEAHRQIPEQH